MLAAPPVALDGLDVLDDGGVEAAVKAVVRVVLARLGLE
jgi:hypothetical protein